MVSDGSDYPMKPTSDRIDDGLDGWARKNDGRSPQIDTTMYEIVRQCSRKNCFLWDYKRL